MGQLAPMRARRRLRERDRPAARVQKTWQQPFGHLPDDLRVDDLRSLRLHLRIAGVHRIRAVQARPAGTAFHRGSAVSFSSGFRSRFSPSLVTGLATPPALPLGLLLGPAVPLSPRSAPSSWACPSRCCPSTGGAPAPRPAGPAGVHAPATPQPPPAASPSAPRSARPSPNHSPQLRDQVTLLASRSRRIGYEAKACSTCTKSSTTYACRACRAQDPLNGHLSPRSGRTDRYAGAACPDCGLTGDRGVHRPVQRHPAAQLPGLPQLCRLRKTATAESSGM
jgi:hypothetical protein